MASEQANEAIEDQLASLAPEQRAQLEFQAMMASPVKLPVAFDAQPLDVNGEPGVLVVIQTPAYLVRPVLLRDAAMAFASTIRKAAQTGPQLAVPPGAGRLVVPR